MKKFIILNKIKYKTIFFYRNFFRKNPFKIFGGNFKFIKKNNKQPLVTIFTCVKNGQETLQKTINSVRMQTYKNIEYIIVDGGSVDGTLEIIKRNNKYINFWISEIDKGTSEAVNKAISLARGKYLFWLASEFLYIQVPFALTKEYQYRQHLTRLFHNCSNNCNFRQLVERRTRCLLQLNQEMVTLKLKAS